MGAGRKNFHVSRTLPISPNPVASSLHRRNLRKNQLGGVIFGCKNSTIKECLSKQLFGLPAQHFSYVKNIDHGLPLFLFNYSDRRLHGIFEATSKGKMYIDPNAWTADCSDRTQYPAQVKIRVRLQCQTLIEDKFSQVIADNYYTLNHFWFELDHRQTSKLMSLLVFVAIAPNISIPRCTMKWRIVSQSPPSYQTLEEGETFETPESEKEHFTNSSRRTNFTKMVEHDEKNLIYMKLKELTIGHESQDLSFQDNVNDTPDENQICSVEKGYLVVQAGLEKKEDSSSPPFEYQYIIAQLMQEVQELAAFMKIQIEKHCNLEQKLVEIAFDIQFLKDRCIMLESVCNLPLAHVVKTTIQSSGELHLDLKESLFLTGGFDGDSCLATMDLYCPSWNVIESLESMSPARSYASAVQSNVELYRPIRDKWTLCSSLNQKKGSLVEVSLNNKIFAIGGGNRFDCFSDVGMLDLDIGWWISTSSMLGKRIALVTEELNGVPYATGGYNGIDYLKSTEIFDPREHSWTKIPNMNTKRGCYSLVVAKEKMYALGGFDGSTMVPSIEVFNPCLGASMMEEQINRPTGYFVAAIVKKTIYVIMEFQLGENIVDMVENYKECQGWQETCTTTLEKKCFWPVVAL